MAIKNIETLNIQCGKSALELMALPDAANINIETEYDGEYINVWLEEPQARQLRDWLNGALGDDASENFQSHVASCRSCNEPFNLCPEGQHLLRASVDAGNL